MTAPQKISKREITRGKVIAAAIECIYRDGFHAAHTNRIAAEAGVSWGVLQYHFGDKEGLLQAVLDQIFEDFATGLATTELSGDDLRGRVRQLIDALWDRVSRKEYRVSVAILRNAGKDRNSAIDGQKQLNEWARKTSHLWDRLFEGQKEIPKQSDTARHLLFAAVRGMADEINPRANRSREAIERECDALAEAITYLLAGPAR